MDIAVVAVCANPWDSHNFWKVLLLWIFHQQQPYVNITNVYIKTFVREHDEQKLHSESGQIDMMMMINDIELIEVYN